MISGKPVRFAHVAHGNAGLAQRLGGAAGGEDFNVRGCKAPGEFGQALLVGNADERAADGDEIGRGHGQSGEESASL